MALQDIFSRIRTLASGVLSQSGGGTLMVAVLEEFSARGVLVRKKGKGGIELLRFLEVNFEQSIDSSKLRLAHLFKQWGVMPTKRILVVTDEFTSTTAELPKPQATRFGKKKADTALKAAARYEISPFLDYPASEAMVGVYILPSPKGEFHEFGLDDSTTVQAMVFAIQEKEYTHIEQVCATLKLKLVGLMPEEVFAFAHCAPSQKAMDVKLLSVDNERPRILVNWRPYDALVALTVKHVPVSFQRHEFNAEDLALQSTLDLVDSVVQEYEGTFASAPMVILGGEGSEQNWRTLVREHAPEKDVKRWDVAYDLPDVQAPGVVPSRYMTAISAGAQALCPQCSHLMIDNHVPITTRIVAHPLALPALILVFTLTCMGLEASWLKYQVLSTEARIEQLEEDKKALDAEVKRGTDAVAAYNGLSKEQKDVKNQMELLESGLYDRQYLKRAFLAGLIDVTPSSIQLNAVQQFSDQVWFLEGMGDRFDVISKYVVQLKNLPMVRQCRLEKSTQITDKDSKEVHYSFSLQVRLDEQDEK